MPIQYAVPQFIDVENKVIGPISVRQFVIVAVEIALVFAFYKTMDLPAFLLAVILTLTVAVLFAFIKINGRPFHYFMLNFMQSVRNPHLRIWKKELSPAPVYVERRIKSQSKKNQRPTETDQVNYVKVARKKEKARARLSELSLLVDTGGYFERAGPAGAHYLSQPKRQIVF